MPRTRKSKQEKVTVEDVVDDVELDDDTKTAPIPSNPQSRSRKSPRPESESDQSMDPPSKQSRTESSTKAPARFMIGSRHRSTNHSNNQSNNQARIIDRRRGEDGSIKYLHREPLSPVNFDTDDLYAWVDEDDIELSDMIYDFHKAHYMNQAENESNVLIEPVDEDDWEMPSHHSSIRIEEIHQDEDGSVSESITIIEEPIDHNPHVEPIVTLVQMIEELME